LAGRRLDRAPRLADAFFLAGRRAADFFAAFLAAFRGDFFADFFADFRADFFELFFDDFRAAFPADFFAAFPADRPAAFREAWLPELDAGFRADAPLSRIESAADRLGMEAGLENAGAGGTGGGSGSDMGLSSIHPPLVQPVSISSDPDIGAPSAQRGATRRRFRPPGPW
jgi:hypothetical protein